MGTIRAIGTDIVDLDHFEAVVSNSRPGFVRHLFTESEIGYCERYKDKMASYAAIFAAKEAFLKALRVGLAPGLTWRDVEVLHERSGAPRVVAHRKCAELLGEGRAHVTLSHSRSAAHAVVIIEDDR
ncbi:MAG: holo-ACP synthase [Candidatus Eisenbacteria bacterium]